MHKPCEGLRVCAKAGKEAINVERSCVTGYFSLCCVHTMRGGAKAFVSTNSKLTSGPPGPPSPPGMPGKAGGPPLPPAVTEKVWGGYVVENAPFTAWLDDDQV